MNFEKIKMQKFLKLAPTCCPTVTVQSKQLLLCGTAKCLMDPHGNFSISPLLRFSASPLLRHTPSPEALAPAYGIWLQLPGPGFSPWALAPTPRPWLQPLGLGSSPQASRAKKWRKFVVKCPKRERRKEEIWLFSYGHFKCHNESVLNLTHKTCSSVSLTATRGAPLYPWVHVWVLDTTHCINKGRI